MTYLTFDAARRRALILAKLRRRAGLRRRLHASRLWRSL